MDKQEDVNKAIEELTGIRDVLCIDGRAKLPSFGKPFMRQAPNRLQALLNKEGVGINELDIATAIDFFMPSTTDFSRSWVGKLIAGHVFFDNPKIITLGCSTGLEVYWIIHFLLKKGIQLTSNKITGLDINSKALEVARSGCYNKYYFDGSFHNREGVEGTLLVDEAAAMVSFPEHLKTSADFLHTNLLLPNCLEVLGFAEMDIIVVMNVLKYMNGAAIEQVLSNINAAIRIGGILISDEATYHILSAHENFEPIDQYSLRCIGR